MANDPKPIDRQGRLRLLGLARETIAARLRNEKEPEPAQADESYGQDRGAFVTLHKHGRLRGCIGNFEGHGSLVGTIGEMALAAAFDDPRFPPLSSVEELEECDIEISALSTLMKAKPEEIEVGRDGIYIINGFNRGVLLPQVAMEQGWDRETFLDQTCVKAGLEPGCWRDPKTKILRFTAQVFGEKEEGD